MPKIPAEPNRQPYVQHPGLAALLLRLAQNDSRAQTSRDQKTAPALHAFVAYRRERIAVVELRRAILVLVVEGAKELTLSGKTLRFEVGSAIALAAGYRGDVINNPDPATGVYRALTIDFPAELVLRTHHAHPRWTPHAATHQHRIRAQMDSVLGPAVQHLVEGLALADLPPLILEHRAMEVLLALVNQGALPLQIHAGASNVGEAVRRIVRWNPERPWTAHSLGAELGLSNATLRRRLTAEGTSLRALIRTERMAVAEALLTQNLMPVREAALAIGYASPSRFAQRFKAEKGLVPSHVRRRRGG